MMSLKRRAVGALEAVFTVIGVLVGLAIGGYVLGVIQNSINTTGLPASAVTGINNVFATGWQGFGLMAVIAIVLPAGVILGAMYVFGRSD